MSLLKTFIQKIKKSFSIEIYTKATPGWKMFWIFHGILIFLAVLEVVVFFATKDGLFYIDSKRMENPIKEFIPEKDIPFILTLIILFFGRFAKRFQRRKLFRKKDR